MAAQPKRIASHCSSWISSSDMPCLRPRSNAGHQDDQDNQVEHIDGQLIQAPVHACILPSMYIRFAIALRAEAASFVPENGYWGWSLSQLRISLAWGLRASSSRAFR